MRADDAKKLPLDQILLRLGFSPVKSRKNGGELWYASPFRAEKNESMHISAVVHPRLGRIWIWKDFGDIGGNVIDFIQRYYGLSDSDVSGALQRLEDLGFGRSGYKDPSPTLWDAPLKAEADQPAHPFTDVRIEPLASADLLEYLRGRGIDAALAKHYLMEVHYRFNGQPFFALAFKNDEDGYEMRSTGRFKGVLPPKTITMLHLEKLDSTATLTVFEGFMDYLSALTHYGKLEADTPVLILNSVVTEKLAIEKIQALGIRKVHLYRDRDNAGHKLLGSFKEQLPDVEVVDHSALYAGYKDFNEFLVARQKGRGR